MLESQVLYYQRKFVFKRTIKNLEALKASPGASEAHKAKIQSEIEALQSKYAASETAAATKTFRLARGA